MSEYCRSAQDRYLKQRYNISEEKESLVSRVSGKKQKNGITWIATPNSAFEHAQLYVTEMLVVPLKYNSDDVDSRS